MGLAVIHSMRVALGGDRGKLTLRISASIRGDSIHVYDLKQTRSQKKGFFADFSPWSPNDLSPSMDWGSTLYMIYVLTLQVWGFFLFCFLYFKVIPVNLECTKRCRNTWAKNLNAYSVSTFTSSSADWLSPHPFTITSHQPKWPASLKLFAALAGIAQWIEHRPSNQRVTSLIPRQGSCLDCGPGPSRGHVRRNHTLMFLSSPSLPLSLKINK